MIVDECHRGYAKADSRWRRIREYFAGTIQIGMTAALKETMYVLNIDYFVKPEYFVSERTQKTDISMIKNQKEVKRYVKVQDHSRFFSG